MYDFILCAKHVYCDVTHVAWKYISFNCDKGYTFVNIIYLITLKMFTSNINRSSVPVILSTLSLKKHRYNATSRHSYTHNGPISSTRLATGIEYYLWNVYPLGVTFPAAVSVSGWLITDVRCMWTTWTRPWSITSTGTRFVLYALICHLECRVASYNFAFGVAVLATDIGCSASRTGPRSITLTGTSGVA